MLGTAPAGSAAAEPGTFSASAMPSGGSESSDIKNFDYYNYNQKYSSIMSGGEPITLKGGDCAETKGAAQRLEAFEGAENVLEISTSNDETGAMWQFNVSRTARYRLYIRYYALENRAGDVEFALKLNGEYPFFGCEQLTLSKVWRNDTQEFAKDKNGNESRPGQEQVMTWQSAYITDGQGLTNDPYSFVFFEGVQTLSITGEMTDFIIDSIELRPIEELPTYADVSCRTDGNRIPQTPVIRLEGEKADYLSHSSTVPMYDRTSAATSPSHPTQIRYNTVGSYNWQDQGMWITWEFDVEQEGVYHIGMRARQNFQRGYSTTRRVYIDGEVPFQELDAVEFPYSDSWYLKTLGDEDPYRFYLTQGRHSISMEIVPGGTCDIYKTLKDSVGNLNRIYRKIIMVTGTTPDAYRDYYLDREIPSLAQDLKAERDRLSSEYEHLLATYGGRDGDTANIERLVVQLDSFLEDFETIPQRLKTFNDNISSLSSWMVRLKSQPLELDYIEIVPGGSGFSKANAGFFASASYAWEQFIGSFFVDYNSVGGDGEGQEGLNVWIGLGRDNVQIIKDLVDNSFARSHNFSVGIRLAKDSMIQATYAGTGPDVALFVGPDQPVNLAARGALEDLTQFSDYDQVKTRFSPQASVPYEYQGGVYALPVTGSFNMMFYRTDIFEELGLTAPQTWDEMYALIPTLQRSNMNVGLPKVVMDGTGLSPSASSIFDTLLMQKGMTYFNDQRTQTRFDTQEALDAFKEWTEYYTKYNIPKDFDFYNRFRTGELPIGIEGFAMYNKLYAGAPEISGSWEMLQVPGTRQEDGTINRATSVNGTSAIIFAGKGNKENAWEFIKWFTSTEIQASYGRSIEALQGSSARYDTANLEAIKQLPWTNAQQQQLLAQWDNVQGIPQVPASYYISRNLYNAFRLVTLNNANPREMLFKYNRQINAEIERKRVEFGLDESSDT